MARHRAVLPSGALQPWWVTELIPLAARGYGPLQIAKRTGRARDTVNNALKHPEVRAGIQRARDVSWQKAGELIAKQMLDDTPKNIAFLQAVRDAELPGAKPEVRDRIQAATRLMDSQLSRKTSSTQHLSGQVGVNMNIVTAEEALDITALARDADIELPALPAPPEES